jgi:hypothetical protein
LGVVLSALLASGCALEAAEEPISEADLSLATANALTANALTANALFPGALTAGALSASPLDFAKLSDDARAALQDPGPGGELSRKLLKYAAGCALGAEQSFDFWWTDSLGVVHDERYPGSLGIEPSWAKTPLGAVGQRMISACLGARINYYGIQVAISARSATAPLDVLGSDEVAAFPHIEGAFWGNLFSATPYLNACYVGANVANSHAHLRDCAAGHVNADGTVSSCGMIQRVGECKTVCPVADGEGRYWHSCFDGPGATGPATDFVVTIALP